MRKEILLSPTSPYDFDLSFAYLSPNRPDPIVHFDGKVFRRVWPMNNGSSCLISIESKGTVERPQLGLTMEAPELTAEDLTSCEAQIRKAFCLDLDLLDFYEMVKSDPTLHAICLKNRGLRPVLEPDLFETITWAIIGQQVNLRFACQVKEGMLKRFARRWNVDGHTFYHYPMPAEICGLDPDEWREFKCSRRKAEYIIGLAEKIQDGFDLEALGKLPDAEVARELVKMRGIGPWTAEYALIRGLGRWDTLPVGDAGLLNGVKRAYGLSRKPTEDELLKIAENWRPYRGLATYYLWWGEK
ncbi:hypothetical protein CEE37_11470 [candidate division LCP-89 bacterium B3_LCP]|uniref:DNA-3-methyladenine glycosylase II n=1 Tax=candidate division LCP-89 bacterium B3_LCP TaxID=2012998 RepID=A0A532UW77_UNCL8|nr:MAG: hypothetical protein CEE37_11470 [candidate division LCP-89 bacterium B3_LCP]